MILEPFFVSTSTLKLLILAKHKIFSDDEIFDKDKMKQFPGNILVTWCLKPMSTRFVLIM